MVSGLTNGRPRLAPVPRAAPAPPSRASLTAVSWSAPPDRRRERGDADIGRSLSLLPALRRAGAACAVSASGIEAPELGALLLESGFDGLLVGTGLLRTGDACGWLDELERSRRKLGTPTTASVQAQLVASDRRT